MTSVGPPPPSSDESDWLKAAQAQEAKRFAKRKRPGEEPEDEPEPKIQKVEEDDSQWLAKIQAAEAKRFQSREVPRETKEEKKEKKAAVRTYEVDYNAFEWKILLRSTEYDDFRALPGVKWDGRWLETLPMQTTLVVHAEDGETTLMAIEKMGYTGKRPPPIAIVFRDQRPVVRTYEVDLGPWRWTIHLRSTVQDDLTRLTRAWWNGTWLQSYPMQATIVVDARFYGEQTLRELERMGYKGKDPGPVATMGSITRTCEVIARDHLWTFQLTSRVADDLNLVQHAKWNGVWTETMPARATITADPQFGPAVLAQLKRYGFEQIA